MSTSSESFFSSQRKPRAGSRPLEGRADFVSGGNRDRRIGRLHLNQADSETFVSLDSTDWMDRVVEALDTLNLAVMATNASGRLLLANRAAQQILRMRDGLQLTPQGTLEMSRPAGRSSLLEVIADLGQGSPSECPHSAGPMIVAKRSMGRRPLTLVIQALRDDTPTIDSATPSALIFAVDSESTLAWGEAGLRQLHGITAREARLAVLLMEGNTLEDCCQDLNIQTSTARMHLGSLFAKTGTQRQSQLVSRLLSSIGVLRSSESRATGSPSEGGAPRSHRVDRKSRGNLVVGLEALDRLEVGIAVVDGSEQLRFANPVTERLMAECTGSEGGDGRWQSFLPKRVCASRISHHGQWEAFLAVPRSVGKRPLTVMVRSLATLSSSERNDCHLIFILDPQRPMRVAEDGLRQLYGLTPCEARIANLLMEGNSLEECCEHLQIRPSTGRMHLSNLFAKTGVQRQGQLVSLLVRTLGMLPAQNPSDVWQETQMNPTAQGSWPKVQDPL